MHIFKRYC